MFRNGNILSRLDSLIRRGQNQPVFDASQVIELNPMMLHRRMLHTLAFIYQSQGPESCHNTLMVLRMLEASCDLTQGEDILLKQLASTV